MYPVCFFGSEVHFVFSSTSVGPPLACVKHAIATNVATEEEQCFDALMCHSSQEIFPNYFKVRGRFEVKEDINVVSNSHDVRVYRI